MWDIILSEKNYQWIPEIITLDLSTAILTQITNAGLKSRIINISQTWAIPSMSVYKNFFTTKKHTGSGWPFFTDTIFNFQHIIFTTLALFRIQFTGCYWQRLSIYYCNRKILRNFFIFVSSVHQNDQFMSLISKTIKDNSDFACNRAAKRICSDPDYLP